MSKTFMIEKGHLLNQKKLATSNRIPLILTYSHTLPDIKRAVNKHWHILKINRHYEEVFTEPPLITFRRNKSLQNSLGKKTIISNKKQLSKYCSKWLCNSKLSNLYSTQVQSANTFKSTVKCKTFKICNKLNCRCRYLINLMKCFLCNKNDTGKSETTFNLRLNNP